MERLEELNRVAVFTWSLHSFFERDRNDPGRKLMDVREFPEMIADAWLQYL